MMDGQTDQLLRRGEVEKLVGLGRSAIYRQMRDGDFPTPIKVGTKAVRWRLAELRDYLDNCPRANGEAA